MEIGKRQILSHHDKLTTIGRRGKISQQRHESYRFKLTQKKSS